MSLNRSASLAALVLVVALIFAATAEAQLRPSSTVLLPYFEVDLAGAGKTTTFAVGNALAQPVDVNIEVRTNWGIGVLNLQLELQPHEARSFDLRDWLVFGRLPDRTLRRFERNHLQATLSGQPSPHNRLFYADPIATGLAVGSVVITAQGDRPRGALWGDYLLLDAAGGVSTGDDLVDVETRPGVPGSSLCARHVLRDVSGTALDARLVIWTNRAGQPSPSAYPESRRVAVDGTAYGEAGEPLDEVHLRLLPVQTVPIPSLGLAGPSGWLDLRSAEPAFIGRLHDPRNRDGSALQTDCVEEPPPPSDRGPRIEIEMRTNDEDADAAPGPVIAAGAPVRWDYRVTNAGDVRLTRVTVSDDHGVCVSCPKTALEPGESMTCTGSGTAQACQYRGAGTVTATAPSGLEVAAEDASHYFGGRDPRIDLETAVNGQDADAPPGLIVAAGSPLTWTYAVTNNGDVQLTGIRVADNSGIAVTCPRTSLRPGEAMTCTAASTAEPGHHSTFGSAEARTVCDDTVRDGDATLYFAQELPPPLTAVKIETFTNGEDADDAPGPAIDAGSAVRWTYTVTNAGGVVLDQLAVSDDHGVPVSCPKTTLQPQETMTCTAFGTAVSGQYRNVGTVVGTPPSGPGVTHSDPSHYFGRNSP
jgi:hypothetical protein